MNKDALKLTACLAFQTVGWLFFVSGFPGQLPVYSGCLALANMLSLRRSNLFVGTLVALLLFMAVAAFYQPHLWAMRMRFPVWFKVFMGIAWLLGVSHEYRSWRAYLRQRQDQAVGKESSSVKRYADDSNQ